jgi:hypothetical protein
MNFKQLYEVLGNSKKIGKEIKSVLLELDTLESTATQASLNDMLIDLRIRLSHENDVVIEEISGDKPTTVRQLDEWIVNDFTEYSSNMYTRTLLQGRRK